MRFGRAIAACALGAALGFRVPARADVLEPGAAPPPSHPERTYDDELAADAKRSDEPAQLFLGLGFLSQNIGRESTAATGRPALFGQQNFTLEASLRTRLGLFSEELKFIPSIAVTPFQRKSIDGGEKYLLVVVSALAAWPVPAAPGLDLVGGPGLLVSHISGAGGSIDQSNGTSSATFALPSGSSTTNVFFLALGGGYQRQLFQSFSGILRVDLDVLVSDLLTSRRAADLVGTFSFGLPI